MARTGPETTPAPGRAAALRLLTRFGRPRHSRRAPARDADRLGVAAEVARFAATLGPRFRLARLTRLQGLSLLEPVVVERALTELVFAGLVRREGRPEDGGYAFAHALAWRAARRGRSERPEAH